MTAKTTSAKKPVKLSLTSRAKSPRAAGKPKRSLRAQLKQIRQETAAAHEQAHVSRMDACAQAVEQIAAPVLAGITGLDGDAGAPPETIGEVVTPAPKAAKAKAPEPVIVAGVTLERETGCGWHHVHLDGHRIGAVFKSRKNGAPIWAAETPDRALRSEGASKREAVDAFVHAYTSQA